MNPELPFNYCQVYVAYLQILPNICRSSFLESFRLVNSSSHQDAGSLVAIGIIVTFQHQVKEELALNK